MLLSCERILCFLPAFRIIAVGYEARACGVTRQMRGDEAKEKCPDIVLARVPEVRGKADLTRSVLVRGNLLRFLYGNNVEFMIKVNIIID